MPSTEPIHFSHTPGRYYPAVDDLLLIAGEKNLTLRNLKITQAYYELSTALKALNIPYANWCTYATWASKQAGQTIRRQDLQQRLTLLLKNDPGISQAFQLLGSIAREMGFGKKLENLGQSGIATIVKRSLDYASEAVSRGNKKVFEEIAPAFANFITLCHASNSEQSPLLNDFLLRFIPSEPPNGQQYLQHAFRNYFLALSEKDEDKKAQLVFLANLQVGFHEQTRLQPEIVESLNAATRDLPGLKKEILDKLVPAEGWWNRVRLFYNRYIKTSGLLDSAVEKYILKVQQSLRHLLTQHLMILEMPTGHKLRLGLDLATAFPPCLLQINLDELSKLLDEVDLSAGSVFSSGALDWGHFPERMHYICDMFRCYHANHEIFQPPFNVEQAAAIKNGKIPAGEL